MIEIYSNQIEKNTLVKEHNQSFLLHNTKRKRHVCDRSQSIKKLQTLIGEFLVRHIISNKLDCDPQDITILLDPNGKPYCKLFKSCHFNISHSGDWVVSAFDNEPVGIDIQKIVHIPRKRMDMIVLRFFHKYEQLQYFNLKDTDKENYFFTQWALKESYIKLLGNGLRIPLQSFSAFLDQNGRGSISDGGHIRYFQQYDIDSRYKLVACSSNSSFPLSLKKITIPSITKI